MKNIRVTCDCCESGYFVETKRYIYDYYGLHDIREGMQCTRCGRVFTRDTFTEMADTQYMEVHDKRID
jgi:transposase-like protein